MLNGFQHHQIKAVQTFYETYGNFCRTTEIGDIEIYRYVLSLNESSLTLVPFMNRIQKVQALTKKLTRWNGNCPFDLFFCPLLKRSILSTDKSEMQMKHPKKETTTPKTLYTSFVD
jgi:hypothetical protein